jgi:hypothetical protein
MCTVGFLPRAVANRAEDVERFRDMFAQILELYDDTPPGQAQHMKSKPWHGFFYSS